jgi:photosystem II stability/assembly factor-like uncharacterized protein
MQWRSLSITSIDHAVVSKSGNIYASSDWNGKLYKSTNDGDTWITMISGLPIESIESVGYDTLIFSTTDSKLYFSFDGGNSYHLNQAFSSRIYSIEFITYIDSSFIVLGTANGFVHISRDFGNSWTSQQVSNSYVLSIKLIQNRMFAATYTGLYYTDDLGQTWQNLVIVQAGEHVYDIESDLFGILYVSAGTGKIYKSTDFGNSWNISLNSISIQLIRFSPENEILAGNYKSTNQGESWINIIPTTIFDICFKDTIAYMVNIDGHLYREDYYFGQNFYPLTIGNKWQYLYDYYYSSGISEPVRSYQIKYGEVIGDTIIDGTRFFKLLIYENIEFFRYGDDNKLYKWNTSSSSECIQMDFNLVWGDQFQSCNGGVLVRDGFTNKFENDRRWKGFLIPDVHGYTAKSYMDSIGYSNYTSSWSFYGASQSSNLDLVNAIVTIEDSIFYYRNAIKPIISFAPIPVTHNSLITFEYYCGHQYSKFSTSGSSRNFIDTTWIEYFYSSEDSSTFIDTLPGQTSANSSYCSASIVLDTLLMLNGYKFYYAIYAKDKALIPQTSRSPEVDYYELVYDPNPISVNHEDDKLFIYQLEQNYPNPFNPKTNFGFRIADFGFVTLKIYDVLGNEIATVINEEKPAGEYEIKFDGSNLPSGIYFYQLQAGSFVGTKKMLLLK